VCGLNGGAHRVSLRCVWAVVLLLKVNFPFTLMVDNVVVGAGHGASSEGESEQLMILTYPPELLPRSSPEDSAVVVVCDSGGKQRRVITAPPSPSEKSVCELPLILDLN
jgi:hypothetical protein